MGGKKLDAKNWNVRFDFFANASFWGEGSFNCCERRDEDEDSMEMLERLFIGFTFFFSFDLFILIYSSFLFYQRI